MVPMTELQSKSLMMVLLAELNDKESFDKSYEEDLKKDDFICQIIEKRVEVLNLPKFHPSAVIFLSILASGNPGRVILAMVDTLKAWKNLGSNSDINCAFVSQHVYPMGFYSDDDAANELDIRRQSPKEDYNFII